MGEDSMIGEQAEPFCDELFDARFISGVKQPSFWGGIQLVLRVAEQLGGMDFHKTSAMITSRAEFVRSISNFGDGW